MKTNPDGTMAVDTMVQPKITGYRQLNAREAEMMNLIKAKGEEVGKLIEIIDSYEDCDPRWLALARSTLQTGFMQLTRSVARPTTF